MLFAMDQGKEAMPIVQWGPILALLGLIMVGIRTAVAADDVAE